MPSSKSYLQFILDQLSELDEITFRAMMGEYILYYRGKVVGGIYDDRLLVKPTKSARALMSQAALELPYEGAKEHYILDIDDTDLARQVVAVLETVTPLPKPKKKKAE